VNAGEQTQNLAPTVAEMENHQQMYYISKLQEKIKSAYYQVKQIEINKIPRRQKLQSMFKIKEIMKTANEATAEKLKDKDLNLNDINHPIHAAATIVTEKVKGTGCYKSWTRISKTLQWNRCIQKCINGVRKEPSTLAEIKRDKMKKCNIKRKSSLMKCN
jgi:exoribonuclease R